MDDFGDRMKAYERAFTDVKVDPSQWMCVRIDGKGFSKFTKKFRKPFDNVMSKSMIETTKFLVEQTHASLGFVQSDEITLLFPPTESERIFGGKVSKINSVFASMATAHFNSIIQQHPSVNKFAYFDCRVWSVPNGVEASNVVLWRAQDARKNSISSLFRWTAGHKLMHGLSGKSMIEILANEYDVVWEDLPFAFKYGTYVKPIVVSSYLTKDELDKIPVNKRPVDLAVVRRKVDVVEVGYFGDLTLDQRVSFLR